MTTLTPNALDAATIASLNERFASAPSEEIIAWAAAEFGAKLAMTCSFGGPSGMVLLDLALRLDPSIPVLAVDTDFLFPETYETLRRVEARYGIEVRVARSPLSPRMQELLHGPALWERDADACCEVRKVTPMRVALAPFQAYLTGLRRDQAETRRETPAVQYDAKFGLTKVNPLVSWGEREVWSYIVANDVPYNPLHDQSYPSLGCTNCTRPVAEGEDPRAGRWSGSDKVECGLHTA